MDFDLAMGFTMEPLAQAPAATGSRQAKLSTVSEHHYAPGA